MRSLPPRTRFITASLFALVGCGGASEPPDSDAAPEVLDAAAPHDARSYAGPVPFEPTDETRAYCVGADDDVVEARITELLAQLTPEEKVGLLAGDGQREGTWTVAGVERLGIPGFRMIDGPRGVSNTAGVETTAFPVAMMRGASFDPSLEERLGHAIAAEARSVGADVILAPTINVLRHPRWGRAQETYGEDTHLLGELGLAFVRGAQAEGVLASAKHFAANSIENTRHEVDVTLDARTLHEVYLPHFERLVREGPVASVMSAYNQVNGLYCDQQPLLLSDVLRTQWGFAGFVESDWVFGTHGDIDSLRAGLDLEMPSAVRFRSLPRALASGELDEREVDVAVRRLLRAMFCYGLDARSHEDDPSARQTPEHLALAREAAARGAVLLRNEASTIPLDASSLAHSGAVALFGRNADRENIGDTGSSSVRTADVVTMREGLEARLGAASVVTFTTPDAPQPVLDAASEAAARAADVVVVVTGLTSDDEGEGDIGAGDRDSLALPDREIELIHALAAVATRLVVLVEGGAAITSSSWDAETDALLFAFYPGGQGGHGLADVLFGDVAPSGRLPFTIPESESDLPLFDSVSTEVTYEYLHGYRYLAARGTAARYPFGFGLSTTTFELEAPRGATTVAPDGTLELAVRVTNTGARAGTETVQLYVACVDASVDRAPFDLRAFGQVTLAPGASGDVSLRVRARDLAYWDETSGALVVEPGEYQALVGTSSATLPFTHSFRVE